MILSGLKIFLNLMKANEKSDEGYFFEVDVHNGLPFLP